MTIEELLPDENCIVIGFTISIKYLDGEGEVALLNTSSGDIPPWENLGMLMSHCDDLRHLMREGCEG